MGLEEKFLLTGLKCRVQIPLKSLNFPSFSKELSTLSLDGDLQGKEGKNRGRFCLGCVALSPPDRVAVWLCSATSVLLHTLPEPLQSLAGTGVCVL